MRHSHPLLIKVEASLSDTSDVYVSADMSAETYFAELASSIRNHLCEPFEVSAMVMPPGFPEMPPGAVVSGQCVAHRPGYWLVYQPEQDRFYCFWGESPRALGAHGVFGSPLYCWSA